MKKITYLLLSGLLGLMITACQDMDLEPKGILDETALLGNEAGAKKYLSGLYAFMPVEDFLYHMEKGLNGRWDNFWDASKGHQMNVTGEAFGEWGHIAGAEGFGYWNYDRIREINTMIEGLPNYKDNYIESTYNSIWGEIHFIRAFYYFGLAKRYGGMPIIEVVQDPTGDLEELSVTRSTETDIYKFIHSDLEIAIENLAPSTERGRANKYAAAALMSRAMLYAGSIAKYDSYTTASSEPAAKEGYVGIPSSEAAWFFKASYDAAMLFEGTSYDLYEKNPDKEQNYVDLFLDLESPEDIFIKQFDISAPHNNRLFHSYDGSMSPRPMVDWPGSQSYPTLETVEKFQELPILETNGTPRRFTDRADLYANLEPRLLATVYFSGMELRNVTFDILRGAYLSFTGTPEQADNSEANRKIGTNRNQVETIGGKEVQIGGAHGPSNQGHEDNTQTGFYVRKYVNYKSSVGDAAGYRSTQAWKIFRYAEVLMNRAEAAYELSLDASTTNKDQYKQDAYSQIAKIRSRAGAKAHTFSATPQSLFVVNGQDIDENLQYIRDERYRELLFENHRWWDIRRWRVGNRDLSHYKPGVLMPYVLPNEGDKYIFIREKTERGTNFNFEEKFYYEKIPAGEMNKNQKLIQNPIY